jgi:hypothetical protein
MHDPGGLHHTSTTWKRNIGISGLGDAACYRAVSLLKDSKIPSIPKEDGVFGVSFPTSLKCKEEESLHTISPSNFICSRATEGNFTPSAFPAPFWRSRVFFVISQKEEGNMKILVVDLSTHTATVICHPRFDFEEHRTHHSL